MENNLLASNSDNILSANNSYFYENSCPKNSNFTTDLNSLMPIDYNEHFTGGKSPHFSNQSLSSPTEEPQEFAPQIYNNNQSNHTFYTNETGGTHKYICNSNYTELLQDHELKLMEAHQNQQRQSANARERSRTFHVNKAFTALRELIPTKPANRKLSKIETLHLAISYIAHLGTLLELEQEELYEQKNDFQGALVADTFSTKQSINNSKQHKRDCHPSPDNRDDDNGHTDIMINCGNNKKIKLSSNNLEQVRADTRLVLRSSHRKLKKYLEKSSFPSSSTSDSTQKYNYKNSKCESNTYAIIENHYDKNILTSPSFINCKNMSTHLCGTQNSLEENKDCLLSNPTTNNQMSITLPVRYCTFCAFNNLLQT